MKKDTNRNAIVLGYWATPHRADPNTRVVPETYPRLSTLEVLLGAGGTYGSVEIARSGGDGLYAGLCLLLPISLFFLYAGAAGLRDSYKAWQTYRGYKNVAA